MQGRGGGGLVVSVLAFFYNDPSSNLADKLKFLYEKKYARKRPGLVHLKKRMSCANKAAYLCLLPLLLREANLGALYQNLT